MNDKNLTEHREMICQQLFRLFRKVQRRNRFVATAHESPLGLTESHILVELDADPKKTAKDLSKIIGIEKSSLSRVIKNLLTNKFLVTTVSTSDRRKKQLAMTDKGKKALSQLDQNANQLMVGFCKPLDVGEQGRLLRYWHTLADGYKAEPSCFRPNDHPYRPEIRRCTRALGLLTQRVFGVSQLSSLQWQVLSELCEANGVTTALTLCRLLQVPANTMSAAIALMLRKGWISRNKLSNDRRSFALSVSNSAREMLIQLATDAGTDLSRALSELDDEQLRDYLSLLKKFAGELIAGQIEIQPRLVVHRVTKPEDLFKARGFLLSNLVRLGRQWKVSETILSSESFNYALSCEQDIKAVCEFRRVTDHWELLNFVTAVEYDRSGLRQIFIEKAFELFFVEGNAEEVQVESDSLLIEGCQKFEVKRLDTETKMIQKAKN